MAAYMRQVQPFLGVGRPARTAALRTARADVRWPSPLPDDVRDAVALSLWDGEFREERYAALDLLTGCTPNDLPLLTRLLSGCDHWDVLDPLATRLLGDALAASPDLRRDHVEAWRTSEHLWTRRAAVLVQLHHGTGTDTDLLAETIDVLAGEREFFIRKAIGWALRQYARTDPDWVRRFVSSRGGALSSLSRREALKHLLP